MTPIVQVTLLLLAGRASGFMTQMTNSSGVVGLASLVSQVSLMAKSIKDLQTQVKAHNSQFVSVHAKLRSTDDELIAVEAELRITGIGLTDAKRDLVKKGEDVKTRLMAVESYVKNVAYDIQRRPSASDLSVMKSDVEDFKQTIKRPQSGLNGTVIGRIGADVNTNIKAIQALNSKVTGNAMRINATRLEVHEIQTRIKDSANHGETETIFPEMDFLKSIVQSNLSSISQDILNVRLDLSRRFDMSNTTVAFYVSQQYKKNISKPVQRFDHLELNEGHGYDETSGYFTAPFTGTYLLWINVVFENSIGDVDILKGDSVVASAHVYPSSTDAVNLGTASTMALTRINAGEQVSFSVKTPGAFLRGGRRSYYGGVLLHLKDNHGSSTKHKISL